MGGNGLFCSINFYDQANKQQSQNKNQYRFHWPIKSVKASFTACQITSAEIVFGVAIVVLVAGWLKMKSAFTILTPSNSIEIAFRRMQSIPMIMLFIPVTIIPITIAQLKPLSRLNSVFAVAMGKTVCQRMVDKLL